MSDDVFHCPDCGGSYIYSVYQSFDDGPPSWSASGGCLGCEGRVEIDGYGLPSPEFRSVILAKDGAHELTIGPGADTISTLRQLQETLALPASAVAPLAKTIPGAVLSGTPYEMEWLASILRTHGIPASSVPKEPSSESGSIDLADLVPADWRGKDWTSSTE